MKPILILFIFQFFTSPIIGQSMSDACAQMKGQWTGTLTYTDYRDDKSQVTLGCKINSIWKKNKGIFATDFKEPNGVIYSDKTKIKILAKGKKVKFDGKVYVVKSFDVDDESKNWNLTMVGNGKDNNKSAAIRQSIIFKENKLSIQKDIKYQGTPDYFTRNIYNLERE